MVTPNANIVIHFLETECINVVEYEHDIMSDVVYETTLLSTHYKQILN